MGVTREHGRVIREWKDELSLSAVASGPQTCGAKPLRVSALLTTEAALSSRSKQS